MVRACIWNPDLAQQHLGVPCETFEQLQAAEKAKGPQCSSYITVNGPCMLETILLAVYNETNIALLHHVIGDAIDE